MTLHTPTCRYPWCTTMHGGTLHPDDEDHRSAGIAVPVFATSDAHEGGVVSRMLEVGVLRRRGDDETWIVVDDRGRNALTLTVDNARRLLRAIAADAALSELLGEPLANDGEG